MIVCNDKILESKEIIIFHNELLQYIMVDKEFSKELKSSQGKWLKSYIIIKVRKEKID